MSDTLDDDLDDIGFEADPDDDVEAADPDEERSGPTPTFGMRWNGTVVRVDMDEFTALDYRRFRQATGLDLLRSVLTGSLEGFAGALWLALRRGDKQLKYVAVAGRVRISDVVWDPPAESDPEA